MNYYPKAIDILQKNKEEAETILFEIAKKNPSDVVKAYLRLCEVDQEEAMEEEVLLGLFPVGGEPICPGCMTEEEAQKADAGLIPTLRCKLSDEMQGKREASLFFCSGCGRQI